MASREITSKRPPRPTAGARQAYSSSEPPITMTRNDRMKMPRLGSTANACTEVSTPERTRNVPINDSANAMIASSTVQLRNAPRFSVTASECISPTPASQGMNEAFSTGSQNHQPPQPSSLYAHQLPSMMPRVRNDQAAVVHGRVQRAQAASSRPDNSAEMANANATEKPTYPM